MSLFTEYQPSRESYWRSVILFGQNVASYKFALAKSLLELAQDEKTTIPLEELAVPFSKNICEHLKLADKQATSQSSKFLNDCRRHNSGEISLDNLIKSTVSLGFNNVLDAFHIVNRGEIPLKFFEVIEGQKRNGIVVTDELLNLKRTIQFENLPIEAEARWRLVETAWSLGVSTKLIQVQHDIDEELLFIKADENKRVSITSCRDALNGYQKGKCFYCFSDISVESFSPDLADVDHFFPHTLLQFNNKVNLNGVWNLILACKNCNRGTDGKFARVPKIKYLERLHRRNNFLIDSHHPLRETLILQTGATEEQRRVFLNQQHRDAVDLLIHQWQPLFEFKPAF